MRLREFANDNVTTWKNIAARNNLDNPNFILPGQKLDVGDDIVLPSGTTYIVKPGDTLSGIAQKIRQGWRPDADSQEIQTSPAPAPTVEPIDPDSTTMGNAIASAGGAKSQSPQTKKSQPNPGKYPGGVAKRSAPKQSAPPEVPKPPVINLPNVDPPEVKRGRPTMPADRDQTRPTDTAKPSKQGYHDPVYDAPPKTAPVDDQPIPGYKYDSAKDEEILKKLQKQDREKQKLPSGRPKPNKAPKDIPSLTNKDFAPKKSSMSGRRPDLQVDEPTDDTKDKLKTIQKNVHGQESGSGKADTSKPNYAGAIGPMQILPKTFDWLKQIGKIPQDYDIKNPEHNKAGGDALLGHYHDKYKGDPAKVYAAYYGGPSAVNKDGSINTHWRDKKNPKAPTVGEYIRQAMSRSGK